MSKLNLVVSALVLSAFMGCSAGDAGAGGEESSDTQGDETGETGETGEPEGMFCAFGCEQEEDCWIDDFEYANCVEGVCVQAGTACSSDMACIIQLSGWELLPHDACNSQEDCGIGSAACVDVFGEYYCLETVDPEEPEPICAQQGMQEVSMMTIDGDVARICAVEDAVCRDDGSCFNPCETDTWACAGAEPECNTSTGECECTTDELCAQFAGAGRSQCGEDGRCGCASDADCEAADIPGQQVCLDDGSCGCSMDAHCAGVDKADTCWNGRCGCATDDTCDDDIPPPFNDATHACVPG